MKKASPAIAYSYIRFSTREQRGNTSIARQTKLRDEFVARVGLILDDKLKLVDDGVSAHRGKHRSDKHALGQFLTLVKAGRIATGSYLIVESLDRLSREEVDEALELLLSLTRAGIKVVQLQPAEVIYAKPVDPMKLVMGIMELSRGYSESKMKSERIAAAWADKRDQARATGKAVSRWCPAWLRRAGDGYEVIPDRAAAVRRMFELAASGFGINSIIRRLIAEGHGPFKQGKRKGDRWSNSYIGRVLVSRAVLGEYLPMKGGKPDGEPIPSYYPAVIPEDLYYKARAGLHQRAHTKAGRSTNGINLFQGIMRHALDGDAIEWRTARDNRRPVQWKASRYVNALSVIGQAKRVSFPVDTFEGAILSRLAEIDPREILPVAERPEDECASLQTQRDEVEAQLLEIEDRIVRGESVAVLVGAAKRLEARKGELDKRLAAAKLRASCPELEAWGTCRSLIGTLAASKDQEATRLRLRQVIRHVVKEVWCLFLAKGENRLAAVQLYFEGGAHRDYLIYHQPARVFRNEVRKQKGWVRSFKAPGKLGELDLRDPKQAAALAKVLAEVDELIIENDEV